MEFDKDSDAVISQALLEGESSLSLKQHLGGDADC